MNVSHSADEPLRAGQLVEIVAGNDKGARGTISEGFGFACDRRKRTRGCTVLLWVRTADGRLLLVEYDDARPVDETQPVQASLFSEGAHDDHAGNGTGD